MKQKGSPSAKKSGKKSPQGDGYWIATDDLMNLQDRLREAQETLDAIRNGEVDALVVSGSHGNQIYSLEGAEQPYRVYVEQMQEGAVTVSAEGLILYCNQRFADMLDQPLEKVMSSSICQRMTEGTWQKISKVLEGDRGTVKQEGVLFHDDHSELPVNFTASRLPLPDQQVICLVITDLSNLKEHEQLRLAKEVAEKANNAKDVFLAALSHELRTPLTPALLSATDLEQDKDLPDSIRQTAALIRRNIELEARLIDDLLDVTRIAQGKLELRMADVDVHEVLHRALEICQSDIHAKKLDVIVELNAGEPWIYGDAVRIQQSLWNVIRNSVKFTPEGGFITIRTANDEAENVWIQVIDTGIGFQQETLARLFNAFEQESDLVTRQFGGLGLGLAITHSIIESHSGSITAESGGHGKGATFSIQLPVKHGKQAPAKKSAAPQVNEATAQNGKFKVLLVEDHKDTRNTMEKLLRRFGYDVLSAESATAALELSRLNDFNVVVSDLGLPDMSGLELMKKLRTQSSIIGIAVSGFGMEDDIQNSKAAGFSYHLTKPISIQELRGLLQEIQQVV